MEPEIATPEIATAAIVPRRRRSVVWAALAMLLLLAAAGILFLLRGHAPEPGLLQVNGRIEGDRVSVAPKLAGRVVELAAREGDRVEPGAVLVRLDDRTLRTRLDQAHAAVGTLQAQLAAQARALEVLRAESAIAVDAARNRLDVGEAELRRAEAARAQQARDHGRALELAAQGFIGPQALEQSALVLRQADEQLRTAAAQRAQAREALRDAALGPQRVAARAAELDVVRARLQEARAAVAEVASALDDLVIRAPLAGTVTARYTELGEVVSAGAPLLELTDLARVYLKAYLPEPLLGRVRRGMPGRIHVDAFPGQPVAATLRYIASQAEFTPKEVQSRDERTRLVYELRLYPDADPGGRLNPGQPADAVIRWRDDAAWQAPEH